MKKTIYKTIVQVEILSEEPIDSQLSLSQIAEEGDTGSFSIMTKDVLVNKELKGIRAAREMRKQASDPEFFGMDEKGNDIMGDY
jgi:hypothetical protein